MEDEGKPTKYFDEDSGKEILLSEFYLDSCPWAHAAKSYLQTHNDETLDRFLAFNEREGRQQVRVVSQPEFDQFNGDQRLSTSNVKAASKYNPEQQAAFNRYADPANTHTDTIFLIPEPNDIRSMLPEIGIASLNQYEVLEREEIRQFGQEPIPPGTIKEAQAALRALAGKANQ